MLIRATSSGCSLIILQNDGIVTYWQDGSGTLIQTPIVGLTGIKANTWYRFLAEITKLTATSARIDVSLVELDAGGNPTGTSITGTVSDTSTMAGRHTQYQVLHCRHPVACLQEFQCASRICR